MAYGYNAPFMNSNYMRGIPQQQVQMQMQPQQMQMQMPDNQQFVPTYQQPIQPIQPMAQPTSDMMIFVLGESEASAYPVAPNNHVVLWDKNNPTIYVKSVNAQGVPSMRVLDFNERTSDNAQKSPTEHKCTCGDKFVFKKDFQALQSEFEALRNELEELKAKPKAKTVKKVVEEVTDGE